MQDVIDLLRDKSEEVPVPLELPDEDQLVTVAEELLLPLPDELKQFLLEVSDVICGHLEPVTAADPGAHTYLPEVAAECWDRGLPRYLIPICVDEQEDQIYCIEPGGVVKVWRDGELDPDLEWESIWDWAEEVWLDS